MSTDTKIKTLIFNKLTQEQYNNADRVPTEFYLTPDTSIDSSEKGAANGVATLDENGKVLTGQIPTATTSALGGVKPDGITITATEDGTISASVSGEAVATKADLQDRVAKAGDTMTGPLTIVYNSPNSLVVKDNRIEMGVATDSNIYTEMVEAFDKNNKRIASVEHSKIGGGGSRATLQAVKEINGENKYAQIHVGFDSSNNMYAACPTPSTNSNSNNIATTQWVRNRSVAKDGDTMTGPLKMSGENEVRFGTDDNYYYLKHNNAGNFDFNIIKNGKIYGVFLDKQDNYALHYRKDQEFYRLLTTADKGVIAGWGMPDYSAGVSVTNSTVLSGFTAPSDGVFMFDAGMYRATINGVAIPEGNYSSTNNSNFAQPISMLLSKGDILKAANVFSTTDHSIFYPLKGVN